MTTLLEAARDLRTTLDAEGAKAEAAGTPMTDEAVRLCKEADLYGALVTKDVGGTELNAADSLDVFTELARADGSIGWVVMAGSTATAYFSSYCPDSFTDVMFADGVPLVAGQFAPNGVAVPKGDAFHISGNYSFGSGLEHAHWAGSGSFTQPEEGDADYIFAVVPKAEAEILGNWDVMGCDPPRRTTTGSTATSRLTARSPCSASPVTGAASSSTSASSISRRSVMPAGRSA